MDISNASSGGNFILLGFSDQPQLDPIISVTILLFHIMTLLNNTAIILLTFLDSQFRTPMYFFLSNLTFLDICYTASIVPPDVDKSVGAKQINYLCRLYPRVLLCLWLWCNRKSFIGCHGLWSLCSSLPTPALPGIMHPQFCKKMAAASWLTGMCGPLTMSTFAFSLLLCGHTQ